MGLYSSIEGTLHIVDGEEVVLRGLQYGEFFSILEKEIKSGYLFSYIICKKGIVDIHSLIIDGKKVKYSQEEHYDLLYESEPDFIAQCSEIILDMTIVKEKEAEKVKDLIWFSDYLSENEKTASIWDCKDCVEKRNIFKRVCPRYSKEEILEMRKDRDYTPYDLLTDEEAEVERKRREAKEREEELSAIQAEEPKKIDISSKMGKFSTKKRIADQRAKKEEQLENLKKSKSDLTTPVESVKYTLKTPLYNFDECPVYNPNKELQKDLQVVFRCLQSESLMTDGSMSNQPFRFVELTSIVKSTQNEIQSARIKKSQEDSKKKGKK